MFWDYLYHDCDHSGIWHVDLEIAQIYIGQDMKVDLKKALELFNDKEIRVIELNSGTKWFLAPFVGFQYGELRDNNKAHISVIKNLDKHNLLEYVDVGYSYEAVNAEDSSRSVETVIHGRASCPFRKRLV